MTSVSPAASTTAKPSDPFGGRQPPYSAEAEQAVLGAMLLDQQAALDAVGLLDETLFYREGHRRLRESIAALKDHDLSLQRKVHYGGTAETRFIISVMIEHDLYHAGEINHLRALRQGNDR